MTDYEQARVLATIRGHLMQVIYNREQGGSWSSAVGPVLVDVLVTMLGESGASEYMNAVEAAYKLGGRWS